MKKIFIIIFPLLLLLTLFAFLVYGNVFDVYRFFSHLTTIDFPEFSEFITDIDTIIEESNALLIPLDILGAFLKFIIDILKVPLDILLAVAKGLGY